MAPPRRRIRKQGELFWAWLAGFIDGDGCIGLYGAYDLPLVSISQKDRHILDVIVKKLGVGSVVVRERRDNSVIHGITFGSGTSQQLCERILPYLVTPAKRERAKAVLTRTPIKLAERANSPQKHPKFAEAMRLYSSGLGSEAVAEKLGEISSGTILLWAKRHGIKRNPRQSWDVRLRAANQYPFKPKSED